MTVVLGLVTVCADCNSFACQFRHFLEIIAPEYLFGILLRGSVGTTMLGVSYFDYLLFIGISDIAHNVFTMSEFCCKKLLLQG